MESDVWIRKTGNSGISTACSKRAGRAFSNTEMSLKR